MNFLFLGDVAMGVKGCILAALVRMDVYTRDLRETPHNLFAALVLFYSLNSLMKIWQFVSKSSEWKIMLHCLPLCKAAI